MDSIYFYVNSVSHYRAPFYNSISKLVSGNVYFEYSKSNSEQLLDDNIVHSKVNTLDVKYFKFVLHSLKKLVSSNVIVFEYNPRNFFLWFFIPILRLFNKKVFLWGIGPRKNDLKARLMGGLSMLSTKVIVYESQAKFTLEKLLISNKNISVIHNTILMTRSDFIEKDINNIFRIIFVGSLQKRKGIDSLISAIAVLIDRDYDVSLEIVGSGPELSNLKSLAKSLNLSAAVTFHGKLTDYNELKKLYDISNISCSPQQAGLSVLQSLSFGVPFLTTKNAITGGEIENISHNVNGWLVDDEKLLVEQIATIINEKHSLSEMSTNSYKFYWENRTMQMMTNRFSSAIGII